ncbi:MAG TPA: trigger factor [Parachlamydiaceae bacterium]|nr:trigger factor [Parachlamydiaceae bacterium]
MSEFKNEDLSVKVEKFPGCQVKLEISVTPKATEAARQKALKNVNKEIVIPGFRKGKAPTDLILQKFKPHVEEEWKSILLNTAFQEALQLAKIVPFSQKSIKPEIKTLSSENGSELLISLETRPEIPEVRSEEITLKNVVAKSVAEKDIEERLQELQLHQATWEDIKDRGIQEGDFVHLDIDSLDEPGTSICKNEAFFVSKGKIGKWLYDLLLNKTLDSTFEGLSEKEDCHDDSCQNPSHSHNHDFKPTKLQIKVVAIKKPMLPEITTEFASKLGAESIEKLHERVTSSLEKNFKEEAQDNLRGQLRDIILEKYTFDLPSSILQVPGQSLNDQAKEDLANSYRIFFITEKLAHNKKLDVTQDEIMQEFMVQAYMTRPEDSFINLKEDPKEINHQIRTYLLEKKAFDYLIENAKKE